MKLQGEMYASHLGWRVLAVKHLAVKIGSGKTPRGGNEVYSESGVVFLRSQNVHDDGLRLDDVVYIDDQIDREMWQTRARPRDVLLNITGASIGRTAIVPDDFPPANVNQHVCIIRVSRQVDPGFVAYVLKSPFIKDQIRSLENGSSREGLNFEQVGNLVAVVPPTIKEQQAITAFLDRKTAQIDEVIQKKQRLIELVQDKRQVLISQAVTRGLDPNVPMKDSGFEWLGKVPKHWECRRLKFLLTKIEQGWSPQCDNREADEDEWGVLKVGCVNQPEFDASEQKALPEGVEPLKEYEIKAGDILMSRGNTRELVGMAALVKSVRPKLLLCDLLYRLGLRHGMVDAEFVVLALRTSLGRFQIERDAAGTSSSMKKIGQETIGDLLMCIPDLQEQKDIVANLKEETTMIDSVASGIANQIEKLREYRQTLISATVTGKIDVRKQLPEASSDAR